jgi:hypothetical protein
LGKYTANSITLDAGTSTDGLADLQVAQDGNTYHINEVAATPGSDLKVDFVNVQKFNWVQVIGYYDGATTHAVSIQLYNWPAGTWDTWDAHDGIEKAMTDHSVWIPCPENYIGTAGNDGDVRVRFNHTMAGDATHDLYLMVVALYNRDYRLDHMGGPWIG